MKEKLIEVGIFLKSGKTNPHSLKKLQSNSLLQQEIINHTKFLSNATIQERLYCINHNIHSQPLCLTCSNPIQFNNNTYKTFCSKKCTSNNPQLKTQRNQQRKQTTKQKYNVENVFLSQDVQDKRKKTILQKYNTENVMDVQSIKNKRTNTNKQRYNNSCPLLNEEVKQKTITTNIVTYGTTHASSSTQVKDKIRNTFQNRYGTLQNQIHISEQTLSILNDPNVLEEMHYDQQLPLTTIANQLGVDTTTISNYFKKYDIQPVRFQHSSLELKLSQDLIQQGLQIECNNRQIISPYELDIVIPSHKLAIEICGLYWHNEQHKDKQYHLQKLKLTNQSGYNLITIFEDELLYKYDIVLNSIKHKCNIPSKTIYARNTTPYLIDTSTKNRFLDLYHIQGTGPGSITYGLLHHNNLVAVMTFIKQGRTFNLNRYATNCNIPGGFTKLLQYSIKQHQMDHITSFADLRWSNGDLYKKNGFTLTKTLPPDYKYVVKDRAYHKSNFRKPHLKQLFQDYNPALTEHQNCYNHNIFQIYDCGLLKFEKDVRNS